MQHLDGSKCRFKSVGSCNPGNGRVDIEEWLTYKKQLCCGKTIIESLLTVRGQSPTKNRT